MKYYFCAVLIGMVLYFTGEAAYEHWTISADGQTLQDMTQREQVLADLKYIASAENEYMVTNGICLSIDELRVSLPEPDLPSSRGPYSYSAECNGTGFSIEAHRSSAEASGPSGATWFSVNQDLEIDDH